MALTSTLFTGLSGLDVNQSRLNVVGNNIANANTVAFKASRALFKPQFYVTDSNGSAPTSEFGGTNPSQRGLGAVVASVEKDFTAGPIETTGRSTDMAIDGDGFFIVQGTTAQKFTRDGSFVLNTANQLVTSNGDFVQGYGVDLNSNIIPGALTNVTIPINTDTQAKETSNVRLEGNLDSSGVVASGASILESQTLKTVDGSNIDSTTALTNLSSSSSTPPVALFTTGQVLTLSAQKGGRDLTESTFTVGNTGQATLGDLMTFFRNGLGIDTTISPAPTPAPGVTLVPDSTNTTAQIKIQGNTGSENALSLAGSAFTTSTGASPLAFTEDPSSSATGESVHTSFIAYDSLGSPLTVDITAVLETKASSGNVWRFYASSPGNTTGNLSVGDGTLTFDNEGRLQSSTGSTVWINRDNTGAKSPLAVKLDFSSMTSLTSQSSKMVISSQDGSSLGTLSSFSIGTDGTITGSYSNGMMRTLGQIAIAMFKNPQGLVDAGGNMYTTGPGSGIPIITSPQSLGAGGVRAQALELANVDLSKEFTNLIIASTGFSASSRVITTSDQLITELLNSSR